MTNNQKIQTAKEILKSHGVKGKFRGAKVSETNGNEVEFYMEGVDGIYCIANIRSRKIRGI